MLSSLAMSDATAIVLFTILAAHDPGRGHPERPERLITVRGAGYKLVPV